MLIFSQANLVLFSVPKTGSTALEMALKPWADIAFYKHRKHTPVGKYRRKIMPFLQKAYGLEPETMAVMRDPLAQLRSWYRYRIAERDDMAGVDFDAFVRAVISDQPPSFADVGSQYGFLGVGKESPGVTHLFAYEKQPLLREFLAEKMEGPVEIKVKNVSPEAPTPLSPETENLLRKSRAADFALHETVLNAGGHLRAP